MSQLRRHYDEHLGPIYEWMAGPFDAASQPCASLFAELAVLPTRTGVAVDLGSGHGLQAVPLARRGFRVIAIDTCALLLAKLEERAGPLPIETVEADITRASEHIPSEIDAAVCMGDTLTHLESREAVAELIEQIAVTLAPGGFLVTTFRDYVTSALEGDERFIQVRSDENRIMTCFLEYGESTVQVHDLVHERSESGWNQRVSSYTKLRLDPSWVAGEMRDAGLQIVIERTERGMVTLAARKQANAG